MIRYLADPANAITAVGLILSVFAISFAVDGSADVAMALALWALLADHLDGVVAKRTTGRPAVVSGIGQMMDTLADLISAGVFPAILLLEIARLGWWTIAIAVAAIGASALRLAVFHVVGSEGDRFIGVPTSWVIPAVAFLFLWRGIIPAESFGYALGGLLLLLAGLQISSLRTPKLRGWGYPAITAYCCLASLWLFERGVT